jgi:Peptidase family M23
VADVIIGVAIFTAACSWTSDSDAQTASITVAPAIVPAYQHVQRDQLSPLIITPVGADPIPVRGSDNKFHVHYELSVFNAAPRAATLTKVETLKAGESGELISTLSHNEVVARSLLTASYPVSPSPVVEIPAGRTLILLLDDVYATRDAVPASVTHRIFATFGPVGSDESRTARLYPNQVTGIGGPVTTSKLRPIVIGPPLTGDGWSAYNGCCTLNLHGNVVLPIGGRLNGSERFAVDWIRYDPSAKPLSTVKGDRSKNESHLAFGQPIIAVADGMVVSVTSDKPDSPPGTFPQDVPFDQLTGNMVVLDIGHGIFAAYAHMKMDSATVRTGEKVKKGQEIGQVGNSGNSSEPHLHFQLQRGPLPFTADQVPWEIDNFTLTGFATREGVVTDPTGGPRTDELPLEDTITNFPARGP